MEHQHKLFPLLLLLLFQVLIVASQTDSGDCKFHSNFVIFYAMYIMNVKIYVCGWKFKNLRVDL